MLETPVLSPSSMNLQWGAFLATGDERHVVNMLDAFALDDPRVIQAAQSMLTRYADTHPRVLEICRRHLDEPAPSGT